jgi:hypothetical protein
MAPTAGPSAPPDPFTTTARLNIAAALALAGSLDGDKPRCPKCGRSKNGKVAVFADGGFHCHGCGYHANNAVDFLVDAGWSFVNAKKALNGQPYDGNPAPVDLPTVELRPEFTAVPDPEVYAAVIECGDVEAAVAFYGRWFIDADSVRRSRVTRIVDQAQMARTLKSRFGAERLIASGLATDEGLFLVNARYPLVEPHLLPDGRVAGLQFRASEETEADIAAHKAYAKARDEAKANGTKYTGKKVDYSPKFLSLRGAPITSRCGFGLQRLAELRADVEAGTRRAPKVYVVEGQKDVLAANTLGLEAYGLAGAGLKPVRAVCNLLRPFEVHVSLDGDDAGAEGRKRLLEHFAAHGIVAVDHPPPDGMDICDVLVSKHTTTADQS